MATRAEMASALRRVTELAGGEPLEHAFFELEEWLNFLTDDPAKKAEFRAFYESLPVEDS